jgi:hypothetical protein
VHHHEEYAHTAVQVIALTRKTCCTHRQRVGSLALSLGHPVPARTTQWTVRGIPRLCRLSALWIDVVLNAGSHCSPHNSCYQRPSAATEQPSAKCQHAIAEVRIKQTVSHVLNATIYMVTCVTKRMHSLLWLLLPLQAALLFSCWASRQHIRTRVQKQLRSNTRQLSMDLKVPIPRLCCKCQGTL